MRKTLMTLVLTGCVGASGMAMSETHRPASPNAAQQSPGTAWQTPAKREKAASNQTMAQGKCAPNDPTTAGEGDPEAPQNRVEYGGG